MSIKRFFNLFFICLIVVGLVACSHKRLPHGAGVGDPNGLHNGFGGRETYSEGLGANDSGYAESSKCRPGRCAPHSEQHYFFDFDSFEVREDALDSVHMQANYLVKHPSCRVRLEGNTDDRGSREYNVALGEKRARAVLDLLKQYGVSSSQITVVSYGAEKPAAGGEDEKSYQCNRRVDLIYSN